MRKSLLVSVALAAAVGSAFGASALAAPGDAPSPPNAAEMQRMQEDRAAMLEAHLAGMKAGLALTAEQEKNWPAFEAAVREVAKARAEAWRKMHEQMSGGERPSPIEHMTLMADRLQKVSADLKAIADASKPLFDSLTDAQKRHFGPLLREFVERGQRPGFPMRHEGRDGPDGEGGPERME